MEFNIELIAILIVFAAFLGMYLWRESSVIEALRDSVPQEYARQTQELFVRVLWQASQQTETVIDDAQVKHLADAWGVDLTTAPEPLDNNISVG